MKGGVISTHSRSDQGDPVTTNDIAKHSNYEAEISLRNNR